MENKDKPAVLTRIIAGGIAGASETLITFPAEFIKTRKQLPPYHLHGSVPSSLTLLKQTYHTSGLTGFYSGCSALATSNALKSGIRFFAFEASRDHLDKLFGTTQGQRSPLVNVLAGLTAGTAESLAVVTPGEALKTRVIEDAASTGRKQFVGKGMGAVVKTVAREEGVRVLWKGAVPVVWKQGTNSAVRFTSFGVLQEWVGRRWPGLDGRVGTTLGIGAVSGVVTVYASMPFDNIKTRLQSSSAHYKGMLECASACLRNEGMGAFWRGTTPRLVRLTLSSGITFAVYDQVVQAAEVFHKRPHPEFSTV